METGHCFRDLEGWVLGAAWRANLWIPELGLAARLLLRLEPALLPEPHRLVGHLESLQAAERCPVSTARRSQIGDRDTPHDLASKRYRRV